MEVLNTPPPVLTTSLKIATQPPSEPGEPVPWQLSTLIQYELRCVPCLFPHYRCKRANMLSHPPNTSTLTPVPANSHSDGQPHSASTLPLLINTFITRWTKHKITLRLGHANRKQTANFSAAVSCTALGDLVLQRITFTFQKNKFYNKKRPVSV